MTDNTESYTKKLLDKIRMLKKQTNVERPPEENLKEIREKLEEILEQEDLRAFGKVPPLLRTGKWKCPHCTQVVNFIEVWSDPGYQIERTLRHMVENENWKPVTVNHLENISKYNGMLYQYTLACPQCGGLARVNAYEYYLWASPEDDAGVKETLNRQNHALFWGM